MLGNLGTNQLIGGIVDPSADWMLAEMASEDYADHGLGSSNPTPEDRKVVSELTDQVVCRASGKLCKFAGNVANLTFDEQVVAATDCRRAEAEYCNVNGRSVAAINGGGL